MNIAQYINKHWPADLPGDCLRIPPGATNVPDCLDSYPDAPSQWCVVCTTYDRLSSEFCPPARFRNLYLCPGNLEYRKQHEPEEWENTADSMCNDKCPTCNAEIEPHDTTETL